MTTLDIAGLSPKERLDLIGELWDSLAPGDVRLTPAHEAELARRMATFEADASAAVPWETIEAELARKSRCMPRVLFTAEAQADLDDALKWNEARAPETAPQFREALRAVP